MPSTRSFIGNKYVKLQVTEFQGKRNGSIVWKCVCDCGKEKVIPGQCLKNGSSKSCGRCPPTNLFFNNDDGTMSMFCDTGDIVIFDSKDYEVVKALQWSIGNHGYATSGGVNIRSCSIDYYLKHKEINA